MTHRVLSPFGSQLTEVFPDGCGPYAIVAALNALDPAAYAFTEATLAAVKAEMVRRGWWIFDEHGVSGGCNVSQVANYLRDVAGYDVQYFSTYAQGAPFVLDDGSDTCLHVQLRGQPGSGGGLAGTRAILIEPSDGSALPGNQQTPHVGNHWIAVGGISDEGTDRGYLIANGDETPSTGPRWISWQSLVSSVPIASLVVWDKIGAPTPAPAPGPTEAQLAAAFATIDAWIAAHKR